MSTHTPGPWKTGTGEFTDEVFEASAHGEDWGGWLICETGGNEANAAYIVRACNAHEELVRALKDAQETLKTAQHYFPKSIKNRDTFHLLNVLANSVEPAIAKAEGRA